MDEALLVFDFKIDLFPVKLQKRKLKLFTQ